MGRPPLAKEKILAAARQIVEQDGAGCLTFDELAKVSGITRGGITYHYPT
ncbi:MAG: TetR/AcrR family transcriptional regulator, partial [Gammaproteobacteria bacterium]|nr:TetR/AcrR family transcriptional regulator [Gammaproteobacteria bacterium]